MKIRSVGFELFHSSGRTDGKVDRRTVRHDEGSNCLLEFYERDKKLKLTGRCCGLSPLP